MSSQLFRAEGERCRNRPCRNSDNVQGIKVIARVSHLDDPGPNLRCSRCGCHRNTQAMSGHIYGWPSLSAGRYRESFCRPSGRRQRKSIRGATGANASPHGARCLTLLSQFRGMYEAHRRVQDVKKGYKPAVKVLRSQARGKENDIRHGMISDNRLSTYMQSYFKQDACETLLFPMGPSYCVSGESTEIYRLENELTVSSAKVANSFQEGRPKRAGSSIHIL